MRKSARFRVEQCCLATQLLSAPLQAGFRFLRNPLPAPPAVFLAVDLPEPLGRRYGVTVFRVNRMSGLGSAFPPVA